MGGRRTSAAPVFRFDACDVAAGERGVVDIAARRHGDAIRARAERGVEDFDLSGRAIEAAVQSGLAGEPEPAGVVECSSVEIGVARTFGQRKRANFVRHGIDADDRVEAAVRHPWCAVRSDDHAVRGGAAAERDFVGLSGGGIEETEFAGGLGGVPDASIGRGRDIVRVRTGGDGVFVESVGRLGRSRYGGGG